MPTPNNTVTLLINGKTHGQWTNYDIVSDLLTPADDFSVTLGRPVDAEPDAVRAGDKVEVRVGGDTVLSGRIDRVHTTTEKGNKTLTIQGRDDAGILLDCSAPLFNAQDMDLNQIIEKIVKPLGLSKQYAEANGVWPWMEPDGTLVVGGPDYTTAPVAELVLRVSGDNNNIKRLEVNRDMAARYSEVTVLAQSHSGKHNIKATAKDESVKLHRPLIVTEPDIDSQAQAERKAKKRLADSRLEGLTITAVVQGHRTDDGTLWQPGQRINVLSEPDGIDSVYFLMARTFVGGRGQGTETVLTLKEDGAWVLDADPPKKSGKTKMPSESRKANGQAPVKPKKRRQAKKPKQELQVI